jgi:catechol 2,3-dioxygenase-like lactoylglutathione lyase family enzyme
MPRIDHLAVETRDPDETAAFYERMFGARVFFEDPDGRQLEAIVYRGT